MNYKIIMDKRRQRKDGKYPLRIRINDGKHAKERALNICINEADWDAQTQVVLNSCKDYKLYNSKITLEKAALDKQILFGIMATSAPKTKKKHSIIDYGRRLSKDFELAGKTGNATIYNTAVEILLRFTSQKNLLFEDIDYGFLNAFQNDLLRREVGVNTISIYLRTIRAIFNKAINEGLTENYPFKKFRIKQKPTPSRALTVEEMRRIVNYNCTGDREFNRDLFLLSFCLIGINFSDMVSLKRDNLIDNRVVFSRKKTHKVYTILLHDQAKSILGKWRKKTEYLLPILSPSYEGMELKKRVQQALHVCNNYMKKIAKDLSIQKPISTYYARYSWANIARAQGYSKDLIAEALGHEYGNKVTGIYLDNYDNAVIDEANSKVISSVFE
jgi:integrase/recombinase XerD